MTEYKTLEEIYKVAGDEKEHKIRMPGENVKTLVDLAAAVVGKENLVKFFSLPTRAFDGKTPYELCEEGEDGRDLLEVKLMDIIIGIHGG